MTLQSVLHIPAQTSTSICHHASQDTILYILPSCDHPGNHLSSHSAIITLQTTTSAEKLIRTHLSAGDVVLIPAWTEYQLINENNAAAVSELVIAPQGAAAAGDVGVGHAGTVTTVDDGTVSRNVTNGAGSLYDGTVSVMITGSGREIGSVDLKGWGGGTL